MVLCIDLRLLKFHVLRKAHRHLARVSEHLGTENTDEMFSFLLRCAIGFQGPSLHNLEHSAGKRSSRRGVVQAEEDDNLGDGGSNTASDLNVAPFEAFGDFRSRSVRCVQLFESQDSRDSRVVPHKSIEFFQAESLDHGALRDFLPDNATSLLG
jgi:hypothetical protein